MSELDIDSCRQLWESDEHWDLRKEFLEKFKDNFDVDRLLCLAQVYTNMELLGCSYPAPLMIQVRELAKELTLATDLQQTRKARQNVQFVKEGNNNNSGKRGDCSSPIVNSPAKRLKLSDSNQLSKTYTGNPEPSQQLNLSNLNNNPGTSQSSEIKINKLNSSSQLDQSSTDNLFADKLAKLKVLAEKIRKPILYGENSEFKCWAALHNTCQKLGYSHSSDTTTDPANSNKNPQYTITLKINDVIVGKLTDVSKKPLKGKVAKQAVDRLFNPTIRIVSDGQNLILREDEDDNVKTITITEQSNVKSSAPVAIPSASTIKDADPRVFQLDPTLMRNFIILDNTAVYSSVSPASVLTHSGQFCKMPVNFEFSNNDAGLPDLYNVCEVFLGGRKVCQAAGPSRAQAKSVAACVALDSLSKVVYTVKIKDDNADGFIVPRSQLFECSDSSTILTESNIGCKMLKMMGWSGGGIGKDGNTGIAEPIAASGINQQGQGLGYSAAKNSKNADGKESAKPIRAKIESLLLDYARSNTFKDLIFSSDFSSEERKHVHKIAHKYNLKSVSRGSGEDRHLTIGRRFTWEELLYNLKAVGGSTEKYELITPQQYIEETRKSASA